MDIRRMRKLQKLGWDFEWLKEVKLNFHPRRKGKYEIKMYDIEELDQEPETGIWVETTRFSDEVELTKIHRFFEGMGYVMTVVETGEEIGRGIIDGSPFDEVSDVEGKKWSWL